MGNQEPVKKDITVNFRPEVESQILAYIDIYRKINATYHYDVNIYITNNNLWDNFTEIRTMNNHGKGKENIPGIQPEYYREVCKRLMLNNGTGSPLQGSRRY
ncbi:TPA: hypothetical protein ACNVO2_003984 [Escherichia coli]|jgi:hypothetical protein